MFKKIISEFIGTFWLVLGGCGSAVLAANFDSKPFIGIGLLGVSVSFGLTVLTAAYTIGRISGGHFNPAVTIGLWMAGRIERNNIIPYISAQLAGAVLGSSVLYIIASGNGNLIGDFAANGYGVHSPGGYNLLSAFVTEFVMTFMFIIIILGVTDKENSKEAFSGIVIGLALTLIHLITIPVTNTSVNPARSICQALFASGWALEQLWLFVSAPILGAIAGASIYKYLFKTTI